MTLPMYVKAVPNYFAAFQIKNAEILNRLKIVQEVLVDNDIKAKDCLVKLSKSHLTLFVMHLDEVHCLHEAKNALQAAAKLIRESDIKSLTLDFEGVGSFQRRVVYVKCKENDALLKLQEIRKMVVNSFKEYGILSTDKSEHFTPHLTIAKAGKLQKKFKFDPASYEEFVDMHFGEEVVTAMDRCGQCEPIHEAFVQLAQILKERSSPIRVAEANITEEEELTGKHIKRIIPTLKFYKKRHEFMVYDVEKTNPWKLLEWVESKAAPAAFEIFTVLQANSYVDENEIVPFAFFKDENAKELAVFKEVADTFDNVKFAYTSNPDVYKAYKIQKDGIYVIKVADDTEMYKGNGTIEDIRSWIVMNSLPLVPTYGAKYSNLIYESPLKSHVYLMIRGDDEDYDDLKIIMQKAAVHFKNKLMFVIVDGSTADAHSYLDFFRIDQANLPEIRICNLTEEPFVKYKPEFEIITTDKLKQFASDYLDGKLKPHIASQELPEDWNNKTVRVLSIAIFDDYIKNSTTYLAICLHKPSNDESKTMMKHWHKLGELFKNATDLVLASLDCEANEVEFGVFDITPTVVMFEPIKKAASVYSGNKTFEDLMLFLDSRGLNSSSGYAEMDDVVNEVRDGEPPEMPHRSLFFWRTFRRWQEAEKAIIDAEKTKKSQRVYIGPLFLTPEVEKFAPPGKDPGNLTVAEKGGISFETVQKFSKYRYLDLSPSTIRQYYRYENLISLQYDQRFLPERHLLLGPDLAAAHFIVHRGGAVKFFNDSRWHRVNSKGEYVLPGRKLPEGIDASNMALMFEGLSNLVNLEKIRFLSLKNCEYVNDWCMSQMKQFENTLEFLDLSYCSKLTADGLSALSCLKKLKYLRLEGLDQVKNIGVVAVRLEDTIPQLQVVGLDYEQALANFGKDLKLLSHENVYQDAKGNVFLKDYIDELYYLAGNIPEQASLADDEMPIFVSQIRKDVPCLPDEVIEEVNGLSDGKLKHLLAGSPSGEWSQETERVLQVEARRAADENRFLHSFLKPARSGPTWKERVQQLAVKMEILDKKDLLPLEQPKKSPTVREHFHSDWHLYNLKRKVADLLPVKLEEFEAKVVEHMTKSLDAQDAPRTQSCEPCNKHFRSSESYEAHIRSKPHMETLVLYREFQKENGLDAEINVDTSFEGSNLLESEIQEVQQAINSEEASTIVVQQCLFCTHNAVDLERNLEHMSLRHGFFIPEVDYCCDLQGLISYLNKKVYSDFQCLWCRNKGKAFRSAVSVQTHMRDKCHCKLYHDEDAMLEYNDFYNYEYVTSSDEDEGDDVDSDDGYDLTLLESGDPYYLTLPSGAVIGHRSLFRYFKQNLRPNLAKGRDSNFNQLDRVVKKYKGLGWRSTTKELATIRRKDQKFIQRYQTKQQLKVGLGSNKLQRHYRDPNGY
ncbi:Protein disulfide-isomerase [Trichinella pseudospiralis]|uniref:Protein disulfide-isomerase n=1 Tax=Trichinella pseudospiralis TaxID=6337 RepID=A0A0V1I263_TRIPS|nr:Protein disulfide-isomerase [Trichinella pseudospiralis]KRZ44613.1 Protein disulfide-isomerase [Trichinella pseudospiralis]